MRLKSLRVKNFRSITRASTVDFSDSTILIGPNNEGKTNILMALVVGTRLLMGRRVRALGSRRRPSNRGYSQPYRWEYDFPLGLQESKPKGSTEFVVDFSLTADDERDFFEEVGSRVTKNLPIKVQIAADNQPKISFYKKGPGGKKVTKKHPLISEFVRRRFALEYIPAVRTEASALDVVEELVYQELQSLDEDPRFQKALQQIGKLQQPILDSVAQSLQGTLQEFVPQVKSVSIDISERRRAEAFRGTVIKIDDGTETELRYKGDGMQSLTAMALMRHASANKVAGKHVVIAVEEPESHLHPGAIHALKAVLDQLSEDNQLVVTIHNPLFVDRREISSNIIVSSGEAKPARTVDEIRSTLGVRASDNLRHAELVLLVEGPSDVRSLSAVLKGQSEVVAEGIGRDTLSWTTWVESVT